MATTISPPKAPADTGTPAKVGIILITLIILVTAANLPLAMGNVALASIGA